MPELVELPLQTFNEQELEDVWAFFDGKNEDDVYSMCILLITLAEYNFCRKEEYKLFRWFGPKRTDYIFNGLDYYITLRGSSMYISHRSVVHTLKPSNELKQKLTKLYEEKIC